MTLVVVQRKKDIVTFNSDSRFSFGNKQYFDQGCKLFKVPICIKAPLSKIEDRDKCEFELTYGMAVAGSTTNAYALKESMIHVLASIQYLTNMSDISIMGIGQLVYNRYVDISNQLKAVLFNAGLSEIILGGYCLLAKRVRILRFFPEINAESIQYKVEEILKSDGIYFSGSGANCANQVLQQNANFTPLQIIKTIVEEKLDESVGGVLQHGLFNEKHFRLSGVKENILNEETGVEQTVSHFIGYDLGSQKVSNEYPMLFISYGATPIDWQHPKMKEDPTETHPSS